MTPQAVKPTGSLAIPDGVLPRSVTDAKATGLFMSSDHRYWMNGKGPYVSVTTSLRVLSKPALDRWKQEQVARAAWRMSYGLASDGHILPWTGTEQEFIAHLLAEANNPRDSAAARGTAIHGLVDVAGRSPEAGRGFPVSPEYQDSIDAFRGFVALQGGSQAIVSSEKAILNLSEGYAGTFDLLMVIKDELWLIDVKAGKNTYPDHALQLAAYGMAEHIALPGDPTLYDFPEPKRYGVLHLRPDKYADGYRLIEYAISDRERLAFLAALELWRWMSDHR